MTFRKYKKSVTVFLLHFDHFYSLILADNIVIFICHLSLYITIFWNIYSSYRPTITMKIVLSTTVDKTKTNIFIILLHYRQTMDSTSTAPFLMEFIFTRDQLDYVYI